ncbi:hypothetical protein B1729_19375 [Microbacterium sp. B35-04]|uniref:hypothetical protein n=1 Tax=unclassified Microbacterium TaxID=2609290 RepID=UPI0013D01F66|nr:MULTISPECIES: hypothetical protein [unclassified Microbacterium]KAF2411616.1 hypothetical protein B1729_19375 [Microbacterium sp. B35-04]KAF2419310.1 hypothetical protein B2K11_05900 [Microbacterium sp. B35-30]
MTTVIEARSAGTPTLTSHSRVRLVAAAPSLWRVLDRAGIVIGHLQQVPHAGDIRFRARRFHRPSQAFRDIGEFWSADEAVECLRLAR